MYYDTYTQFGNKNINNDQFCIVTIFNFFFTASFEAYFEMGKNHKLNEFECGQVIGLFIGGRTHEAIGHIVNLNDIRDGISKFLGIYLIIQWYIQEIYTIEIISNVTFHMRGLFIVR